MNKLDTVTENIIFIFLNHDDFLLDRWQNNGKIGTYAYILQNSINQSKYRSKNPAKLDNLRQHIKNKLYYMGITLYDF